eukprot:SAG25_NODE_1069_length_4127_cov_3.215438_3_plen_54_part_00
MVQQLWAQRSDVRGASHYKRAKGGKRCLFLSFLSSSVISGMVLVVALLRLWSC